MSLESCVQGIKEALDINVERIRELCEDLTDEDIVLRLGAALMTGMIQNKTGLPIANFAHAMVNVCMALCNREKAEALENIGWMFCESEKLFGADPSKEEQAQIIQAFHNMAKTSPPKSVGLNIALGVILLCEPWQKTQEEIKDSLAKIRKALEGVI